MSFSTPPGAASPGLIRPARWRLCVAGRSWIDIRCESDIVRDGAISGALVVPRNALEWRLDPGSPDRCPHAPELDDEVILMCDEGFQSSLAAATLRQLGFVHSTDIDGGFRAWRAAGLPVQGPGQPD